MTIPKSQGAWRMKEKKDHKSTHEISTVWMPQQDLNKDNIS